MSGDKPAFVTGSHAYGTPHEDSDIDIVVFMPSTLEVEHLAGLLSAESKCVEQQLLLMYSHISGYGGNGCVALRSGKLNLLVCFTEEAYEAWSVGTDRLITMALTRGRSCTREEAVAVFDEERIARGLMLPKGSDE